jgi:hypothetical protein
MFGCLDYKSSSLVLAVDVAADVAVDALAAVIVGLALDPWN